MAADQGTSHPIIAERRRDTQSEAQRTRKHAGNLYSVWTIDPCLLTQLLLSSAAISAPLRDRTPARILTMNGEMALDSGLH